MTVSRRTFLKLLGATILQTSLERGLPILGEINTSIDEPEYITASDYSTTVSDYSTMFISPAAFFPMLWPPCPGIRYDHGNMFFSFDDSCHEGCRVTIVCPCSPPASVYYTTASEKGEAILTFRVRSIRDDYITVHNNLLVSAPATGGKLGRLDLGFSPCQEGLIHLSIIRNGDLAADTLRGDLNLHLVTLRVPRTYEMRK